MLDAKPMPPLSHPSPPLRAPAPRTLHLTHAMHHALHTHTHTHTHTLTDSPLPLGSRRKRRPTRHYDETEWEGGGFSPDPHAGPSSSPGYASQAGGPCDHCGR
jgi:hypothetical protein